MVPLPGQRVAQIADVVMLIDLDEQRSIGKNKRARHAAMSLP